MPLTNCWECQNEISSTATVCPKCGATGQVSQQLILRFENVDGDSYRVIGVNGYEIGTIAKEGDKWKLSIAYKTKLVDRYEQATSLAYDLVGKSADSKGRRFKARLVSVSLGAIAAGFALGWVAGVAAFLLFISILPREDQP